MKELIDKIRSLTTELPSNPQIITSNVLVLPSNAEEELSELEATLQVRLSPTLKEFYVLVGGLRLNWIINRSSFAQIDTPEDADQVAGAINILDPYTMLVGTNGAKWKDIFWFDDMPASKREIAQSFVAFDFPSSELVPGFLIENGIIGNNLYLYDSSEGFRPWDMSFTVYLELLYETRGFIYWQELISRDAQDLDRRRMFRYLERLFPAFNGNVIPGNQV